jgi:hypothetical protein
VNGRSTFVVFHAIPLADRPARSTCPDDYSAAQLPRADYLSTERSNGVNACPVQKSSIKAEFEVGFIESLLGKFRVVAASFFSGQICRISGED